uniref:Uncharacterized protein n=1 Tax=Rhizophora mucronata TaxID=61149 RepID=A0A2P2L0M3_RHIMU
MRYVLNSNFDDLLPSGYFLQETWPGFLCGCNS